MAWYFLAVGLMEGVGVARVLESNRVINDVETGPGTAKTHEDGSLEWRVDGGRGEMGSNRDGSCALTPAVLYVQY
jgi:hypothetical protein